VKQSLLHGNPSFLFPFTGFLQMDMKTFTLTDSSSFQSFFISVSYYTANVFNHQLSTASKKQFVYLDRLPVSGKEDQVLQNAVPRILKRPFLLKTAGIHGIMIINLCQPVSGRGGYFMNSEAKTADDFRVVTARIVRPNHLNGANRLFGGILMQWIDEVAGIVVKRHQIQRKKDKLDGI
jgi:hypothetical protein